MARHPRIVSGSAEMPTGRRPGTGPEDFSSEVVKEQPDSAARNTSATTAVAPAVLMLADRARRAVKCSDAIACALESTSRILAESGLTTRASVVLDTSEDEDNPLETRLLYQRENDLWGLYVATFAYSGEDEDGGAMWTLASKPTPITKVSRSLRTQAARHLPDLLRELEAAIELMQADLDRGIEVLASIGLDVEVDR